MEKHTSLLLYGISNGRNGCSFRCDQIYNCQRNNFGHTFVLLKSDKCLLRDKLVIGNCNKYYFTFKFKVRMSIWIYQISERDRIPIRHSSNKSNPNTDKPTSFKLDWI